MTLWISYQGLALDSRGFGVAKPSLLATIRSGRSYLAAVLAVAFSVW